MQYMNPYAFPGLKYHVSFEQPHEDTLERIASFYGFELPELLKKNRKREIVFARMVCMSALRFEHGWTLKKVGVFFNQDHTTVMHAIDTVKNLSQTDEKIRVQVKRFCPSMLINSRIIT